MSKSGGCQFCSCEFEGHRPYFRLLLEESGVAAPEFTGPPTNYEPSTTDCVSELWYASPEFARRYIGITADEIEQVENEVNL